jgi:hypothetical protein
LKWKVLACHSSSGGILCHISRLYNRSEESQVLCHSSKPSILFCRWRLRFRPVSFHRCSRCDRRSHPTGLFGRPYSQYAKVIKYSYLDSIIQPQGWKAWSTTDPRLDGVTFAEFENTGPGNWGNNAASRIAFGNATLLTSDTYTLSEVMASTSWIDMTYWNSIVTPQPSTSTVPPTNTTGNSTSPPAGACVVSKTAITGQTTYSTIAGCISSLPSTSALAIIFIYPGTYDEQLNLQPFRSYHFPRIRRHTRQLFQHSSHYYKFIWGRHADR